MDPRKLRRLLDTYRDAGVVEVQLNDKLQPTLVRFAAMLPPPPTGDVEGNDVDWATGAPMGLQKAVESIRKAYAPKAKAS